MKCSDIDTDEFLAFIRHHGATNPAGWVQMWDLQTRWPDIPPKLLQAKARNLIAKGRLGGCGGDFHIPLPCCGRNYGHHRSDCDIR